ncbi:MAG TPA: hypothetical protein VK196_10025 [Magnetospirillum sp.]|nr:hypothetical protein [Magnetospirillum sp.]
MFAGAVGTIAVVAVVAGITVIDSPAETREQKLDAQRVADLRRIAFAVDAQLRKTGTLPANLNALKTADQVNSFQLADPVTAEPYDYKTTGPRSYQLCATFSRPTPMNDGDRDPNRTPEFWNHSAGRHCFSVEVAMTKSP